MEDEKALGQYTKIVVETDEKKPCNHCSYTV